MRRCLGLPPVLLHAELCLVCERRPRRSTGMPAKVPVCCVAIISFCLVFSTLLRDAQDLTTPVFNRTDKARVCASSGPFASCRAFESSCYTCQSRRLRIWTGRRHAHAHASTVAAWKPSRPRRVQSFDSQGCTLDRAEAERVAQAQLDMEGALTARDRVGIQDFVLLDETTEVAFLGNLKKRFSKDLIYVSLEPFQHLPGQL